MCNPLGLFARCMGNQWISGLLNIVANLLSLVVLSIAAHQNFTTTSKCGTSFEAYSGGSLYMFWIYLGGAVAIVLLVFSIVETILDIIFDLLMDGLEETNSCHAGITTLLGIIRSTKKYYMLLNNAIEPFFLLWFAYLLTEAASNEALQSSSDANTLANSMTSILSPTQLQETKDALKARMTEATDCVDTRYRVIADTGIGGVILVLQATLRQFIDVGNFIRQEIEGDERDTVENYRRAYDRAVPAFGAYGAVALLIGYSDQWSDMDLIIRASDVPDDAKELVISGMHKGGDTWTSTRDFTRSRYTGMSPNYGMYE